MRRRRIMATLYVDTGDERLKEHGNHTAFHMHTVATFATATGQLNGTTRTESHYDLRGFTGGVQAFLVDANSNVIYMSQVYQYEVKGRWIPGGSPARDDQWNEQIDPGKSSKAVALHIVQFEDPDNHLLPILESLPNIIVGGTQTWNNILQALCEAFPNLSPCC